MLGALVAGALLGSPRAAAEPPGLAEVDSVVEAYIERGELAGAVVAVWRDGRLLHERAYGRRSVDEAEPMLVGDRFRIASLTKPVVAVATLILAERGALALDDPVEKYLPEFRDPRIYVGPEQTRPAARPITVRQLLAHTSGLGGHFEQEPVEALYAAPGGLDESSLTAFVTSLARHPLIAEPGTRWVYSYSYEVVGRLLEVVSGMELDALLDREVFGPLGMEETGFSVPPSTPLPAVHLLRGGALEPFPLAEDPAVRPAFLRASGGLYSTVRDYLRFARLLYGGGALEGRRLLSERSMRELTADQLGPIPEYGVGGVMERGSRYGLGVGLVVDREAAGHPGGNGAFYWAGSLNTFFLVDPEWKSIEVLFTQYLPFRALPIEPDVRAAIYRSLAPPPFADR